MVKIGNQLPQALREAGRQQGGPSDTVVPVQIMAIWLEILVDLL
jgi:hypothetical protein